jgi:VanZ family protein
MSPDGRAPGALLLSWVPALLAMGTIFYLSSLPGDEIQLPEFRFSDKAVHFLAYTVLGALIGMRRSWRRDPAAGLPDPIGLAVGILFGVSDEVHQLYVPLRMFSVGDMVADGLGVMAGVWLSRRLARRLA